MLLRLNESLSITRNNSSYFRISVIRLLFVIDGL